MERILPVASQWTMGQYGKCYWIKTIWKIRQFIQTESNRSNWYARIRIKYTAKTHWHMVSRTNAIIVCKQKLPLFLRWLELIFKVYIQVESNFVVNHLHGTFSFEGVFSVWSFGCFRSFCCLFEWKSCCFNWRNSFKCAHCNQVSHVNITIICKRKSGSWLSILGYTHTHICIYILIIFSTITDYKPICWQCR